MKNWIIPIGLIALSTVFLAKWPIVTHIFIVSFYSVLGAFQFAPKFRKNYPNWQLSRSWLVDDPCLSVALGAGTQVITHIPWFLFPSLKSELTRATFMEFG